MTRFIRIKSIVDILNPIVGDEEAVDTFRSNSVPRILPYSLRVGEIQKSGQNKYAFARLRIHASR